MCKAQWAAHLPWAVPLLLKQPPFVHSFRAAQSAANGPPKTRVGGRGRLMPRFLAVTGEPRLSFAPADVLIRASAVIALQSAGHLARRSC